MDSNQHHSIVGPSDQYDLHNNYGMIGNNYGMNSSNNLNRDNNTDNHNATYNATHNQKMSSANMLYNKPEFSEPTTSNTNFATSPKAGNNNAQFYQYNSPDETKVCIIVDSRTPVVIKIQVPPDQITLADLKRAVPAIDRLNYKYFFKTSDSEFGVVKEEIQDDDGQLPTYRNRVVAWIVTPKGMSDEPISRSGLGESESCNYTATSGHDDSIMTTDIESTNYFTETDNDSISYSNYSGTTCDTFISQRRLKHRSKSPHLQNYSNGAYKNHFSGQTDHKHFDNTSCSTTSSSASQSGATAVHCITVHLVLTNENFLGLHIYANSVEGLDEGIYIEDVKKGSAVAMDGRIEPGDKLIQVNETNLEELSNEDAVRVLKDAVYQRGPLKLVVAKLLESNKNDGVDGLLSDRDAIHPIDTAAWVAHAQAITMPNTNHGITQSVTSSPSSDSHAQDTYCIRPSSAGIARLTSGLNLVKGTTDIKEIIHYMKMPEAGLNIKDREWLKIQIPKAFLGSDLVTWLERNVYGFDSNRDAKRYASRMLKDGYIRDPLSKKPFSSKSYYTFVV